MTNKVKLVYNNRKNVRPPEGSPELADWLDERAKQFSNFIFDESRELPELDENTNFLCGSWGFLYQSDVEIDAENKVMEKAEEKSKLSKLKVVK